MKIAVFPGIHVIQPRLILRPLPSLRWRESRLEVGRHCNGSRIGMRLEAIVFNLSRKHNVQVAECHPHLYDEPQVIVVI